MADLVITNVKAQYDWIFNRGGSVASRVITIDDVPYSAEGVSKATAFRDIFTGAASSPFTAIDATKFWQPTGWRDTDDTEEEWTTVGCNLSIIKTDEWQIGGGSGSGGSGERDLVIGGASDAQDPEVTLKYNGITSTDKPVVNVYYNGQWNPVNVNFYTQGQNYYFVKTDAMTNAKATVYLPANGDYPAEVHEFTIAY